MKTEGVDAKMDNMYLTTPQFAKAVGRSVLTIKKWDQKGFVKPIKRDLLTGYRYYTQEQVKEVLEQIGPAVIGNRASNGKTKGSVLDAKTNELVSVGDMLTTGEIADILGKSVATIKLWDKEGKIVPCIVDAKSGRRFYSKQLVEEVVTEQGIKNNSLTEPSTEAEESQLITIGEFAKLIGKTPLTLKNWEKKGKLMPAYVDAVTKYRYYTKEQVEEVLGGKVNG